MSRSPNPAGAALEGLPGGLSALAAEAGISQTLLSLIKSGRRSLTPRVATQLADTLDRWAVRYSEAARIVRSHQPGPQ
jgi:hypothetical protein